MQLDAHPDIAIPAETGFGPVALAFAGRQVGAGEVLDALTSLPTWGDLGVEREEIAAALARAQGLTVGAALRCYYETYAAAQGKPRWGDKTPGNVAYMADLAAALPEAHFIHLIRDGRDVAASLRGLPFAPGDGGIAAIAGFWRDTIARARRLGAELPFYRELRYEQLVAAPEATLRELCDFLELPFGATMLQAHERAGARLAEQKSVRLDPDGSVRLADGTVLGNNVQRPPDPGRAGRWRETLSEHDVAVFERLAGGMLIDLGYAPSYA